MQLNLPVFWDGRLPAITKYISYLGDNVLIQWHTARSGFPRSVVDYKKSNAETWIRVEGTRKSFPDLDRNIHTVILENLEDGIYFVRFQESEEFVKFKVNNSPANFRLAIGSDYQNEFQKMALMARTIGSFNPNLHVINGDLAECDGIPEKVHRWELFWDAVEPKLVDKDDCVIPILTTIGNHEVRGGYGTKEDAPYYYAQFEPRKAYDYHDFGDLLRVILLDSQHTTPIEDQAEWLEQTINSATQTHIIPIYHISGYPSSRGYNDPYQTAVREMWGDVIQSSGKVEVVFEGHEHCYQRTVPINGVRYYGAGPLAITPRTPTNFIDGAEYLADAKGQGLDVDNANHVYIVDLTHDKLVLKAVNIHGEIFHEEEI